MVSVQIGWEFPEEVSLKTEHAFATSRLVHHLTHWSWNKNTRPTQAKNKNKGGVGLMKVLVAEFKESKQRDHRANKLLH